MLQVTGAGVRAGLPPQVAAGSVKLHAQGLHKAYGASVALHPIELKVRSGELLTLLGPSGSGKTTLLQLICGLVDPSGGRLVINGHDQTDVPASKRDIGVVFQNYALFPHLTVAENVAFPLQMRKLGAGAVRGKVADALAKVGLQDFGKRFPSELSGGQQQRVALARCLVYAPSLILMDESLSALDRKLRESLQIEIKRIHRETGSTIVFVTHDQDEALALSDRICLMSQGRIAQLGTPEEIYEEPNSIFAAEFIGISNLFRGTVNRDGLLDTPDGLFPLPARAGARQGQDGAIVVRPEYMVAAPGGGLLTGRLTESIYAGSETRLLVTSPNGTPMTVRRPAGSPPLSIGSEISVTWRPEHARFLDA